MLRLKEYKAKLIVFPKKANKPKKGDADVRTCVCTFIFVVQHPFVIALNLTPLGRHFGYC